MWFESGFGTEDNHNALQLFVWSVFVPLMKMVRAYDLDMLNKVTSSSSSSCRLLIKSTKSHLSLSLFDRLFLLTVSDCTIVL